MMPRRLGVIAVLGLALTSGKAGRCGEVIVGNEIFASKEAAEMVTKARSFDPNFCRPGEADREKAVSYYERAIAIQPGGKINPCISARIAQLYAYYEDRSKGVRAEPAKALSWWRRCIQESNPRQLLWAQAQAGLGSSSCLTGRAETGIEAFRAVLSIDSDNMELPPWKTWTVGDAQYQRLCQQRDLQKIRDSARKAKVSAVERIHYALSRYDGAAAASAMIEIAKHSEGTPHGKRATELLGEALSNPGSSVYRYRGVADALTAESARVHKSEKGTQAQPEDLRFADTSAPTRIQSLIGKKQSVGTEVRQALPAGFTSPASGAPPPPLAQGPSEEQSSLRSFWITHPWTLAVSALCTLVVLAFLARVRRSIKIRRTP